ncbi:hypothetical protein RhiirA4_489506 [Rhizophagus irregularis]|uniref:Uncharacterized protein n=1 Tax=Rhizophagus irregularis TaxID=588596 RepID=A0A2I1HUU0_9GLOM|nr:hypothetical protein RhiirA4_489506 [Rhizophagus irregularis]
MYENGEGIVKNMNKAIYWYKKSAEQENKDAQNKLKKLKNKNQFMLSKLRIFFQIFIVLKLKFVLDPKYSSPLL